MKSTARVVVIGGGAMGCSLLYHLTKLGWSDVVLVEKNELTAGSTWHAAGLCTHYAHNITIMNLRAHSVRLYSSILAEETGQPVSFHACGALRVTREPDRLDEFRHVQGLGRFAGFDFHILDPDELAEIYPLAATGGLLGAIYEPLDGYVDPSQATHAMAKGARNGGAQIYRHNPVEGLERHNGEWLVHTRDGSIRAEHIVNAAGTWCREIGELMGVDLPVVPMLHQYLVTDRIEAFADLDRELPMIRDPDESWYLRQERDGVIIGPYEPDGLPWSIDGVPPEFGMELLPPDMGRIEGIAFRAMERVPAAGQGGIREVVNGPITFTPDANPLIGPAFGLTNAWLLTGSSMGIMEGGGAGKFLAEWMVGGEPPMDALAVDARRFGDFADRAYRVDKAVECFAAQFGIHYPFEERPAGRMKRVTPIHERLRELGAVYGSVYGWERPNWFAAAGEEPVAELGFGRCNWFDAVARECETVSERVGLADLSVFSKFTVCGADAERFMATLGANRPPAPGRIGLTHALTESGGVHSEFSVTRTSEQAFYLTSAAAAERLDEDLLRQHARRFESLEVSNVTRERGVIGVMGPRAAELLGELCDRDLTQAGFPWLSARYLDVAGVEVLALRVSFIGESGWELHHDLEDQAALFDALWQAGGRFGAGMYGAFAMNAMRLEKGYRAWGAEFTTERTLLEAGGGRFFRPDDPDARGVSATRARHGQADHWHTALLQLDVDEQDAFYAHTVLENDRPIGLVTSGAYGHRVQCSLALAYFRHWPASSDLSVLLLGRKVAARILDEVPYDPANEKCRA